MAIDKMKILRGDPIVFNEHVTLYQPVINDIVDYGEDRFFSIFWSLCSSPYDRPSYFDDIGIDFMSVSDWDYFLSVAHVLNKDATSLVFGDLDFSELILQRRVTEENEEYVMVRESDGFIFDEALYKEIIPYLREMVNFHHTGKKAANKGTAKLLIMDDRKQRERSKDKEYESMLFDVVISLVNTEEFSYTYKSAMQVTLYQLMKSFVQINGKKSAMALLQGSMSGFMDTSGISSESFSWVYSDEKYAHKGRKLINQKVKKK